MNKIDTTILDNLIVGRVEPHIYAFSTETVPNYLKVGDTYRPVNVRLSEWKTVYPNLVKRYQHSARIDDDRIFRDYAVHEYLINKKGRVRLQPGVLAIKYYSNEFFKDATPEDIDDAVKCIAESAVANDGHFHFYTLDHLPIEFTFKREKMHEPRPNQKTAIDNFKKAVAKGRSNLLMYAVMRFGKSFTALCCAKEINARVVLVVSAKADVKLAWKEEVESHVKFADYVFIDKDKLDMSNTAVSDNIANNKNVLIFLTLQDLQGTEIKERHNEIFNRDIDLLIVDETHYGARAEQYGKVLRNCGLTATQQKNELQGFDASDDFDNEIKSLKAKIRLHLSGTPYRILMGNEFEKDDIITFCQFADIVENQQDWDRINFKEEGVKEWDNPYYGFPQMIRFAFNPSKSAVRKLEEIRKRGCTYAFSELFRPLSISQAQNNGHLKFSHEAEILDIFKAIDGSKFDENLLAFLNYDKINDGKMCRHIVCVLPFRASCDALETLLRKYKSDFLHLNDYEIINIAGLDSNRLYPDIQDVKDKIQKYEDEGRKTLTLTVNRMLTGCTVKEWDTMLYFKDTASPQEYDQSIFRLQNQYIKTFKDENGDIVKYNMKPQTLLVDFDPNRLFQMQELKSLFYNVNTDERGNDRLEERIRKELAISPIFSLNKDRMVEVIPANIIDAVREYSKNKSIIDEAIDVPFDNSLLEIDEIKKLIESIQPIDARKGLEINANEGEGDDLDVASPEEGDNVPKKRDDTNGPDNETTTADDETDWAKKFAAYYMRVLFFAFLTSCEVRSIRGVINSIKNDDENRRIASHVGLQVKPLELILMKSSPAMLNILECKIQNINQLGREKDRTPLERATVAMKKFTRVSDAEVIMPQNVADDLVAMIPANDIGKRTVFLDLASKQAELACAIYRAYHTTTPEIGENIYSVASSPLAYELTRKIYVALGMPVEHILNFVSDKLIAEQAEEYMKKLQALSPDIVVAGPPYQKNDGGGRGESGTAIYHKFFDVAKKLNPKHISMFLKANWYSGGRGDGLPQFRQSILEDDRVAILHDYPDPTIYIDTPVALRGGVCTLLWSSEHSDKAKVYNHINSNVFVQERYLKVASENIFIRYNAAVNILTNILSKETHFCGTCVETRNPYDLQSNCKDIKAKKKIGALKVYLPRGRVGYILPKDIPNFGEKKKSINSWKVIVAKASPGTDTIPHSVISTPIVSEPGSLCTDSHLLVCKVTSKKLAENLAAYMKTFFFRFMMLLAKNNQNMTKDVFRYVPFLDLNTKWTDKALYERFEISYKERMFIESVIKPWRGQE